MQTTINVYDLFFIYNYLEYYMLCFYFKRTYSLCQYELFKITAWRTCVCQALALFSQVGKQMLKQDWSYVIDTWDFTELDQLHPEEWHWGVRVN